MKKLQFGKTTVRDGQWISVPTANQNLMISYPMSPQRKYAIIFYDLSAPYPSDPHNSPYLHYLVINVPGNNIADGDVLMDYLPPDPPRDSDAHTYYLEVYEQKASKRPYRHTKRDNFDLDNFKETYGISAGPVASFNFRSGHQRPSSAPARRAATGSSGNKLQGDHPLTEREVSYCNCLLGVAGKQPSGCTPERAGRRIQGETCYNPFAVCAKSVGTTSRKCNEYYDYDNLSDPELIAAASLIGVKPKIPYNRDYVLREIGRYLDRPE